MKCPKGSELMRLCYEEAVLTVDEHNTDWHKPINILNKNIKELGLSSNIRDFSNQDLWNVIVKYILGNPIVPDSWHAFHWANEEWRRNMINKNWFKPNTFLGKEMAKYGIKSEKVSYANELKYYMKLNDVYRKLKGFPLNALRKFLPI